MKNEDFLVKSEQCIYIGDEKTNQGFNCGKKLKPRYTNIIIYRKTSY